MKYNFLRFCFFLTVLYCCSAAEATAQSSQRDTLMNVPMFYGTGGYDIAGGDMKNRFGNNFEVGIGFLYKTRSNWMFGLEMNYLFGDHVKENVLAGISTSDGQIIGKDGLDADIRISERGTKIPVLKGGRMWSMPVLNGTVNSGFITLLGVGLLQHKINFEDVSRTANQIDGDYAKGYDRLTNGLALTQNFGYLYLDRSRRINFFIMAEITEGFTKSRRDYNFDTMEKDTRSRLDLLYGLKVGWIFPVYKKLPATYYYN